MNKHGRIRTVAELAARVASDPDLSRAIQTNPAEALADIATPLQTDNWIYRIVVIALGSTAVLAIVGGVVIAIKPAEIPELLLALGSAAVGALAGLLAPPPTQS